MSASDFKGTNVGPECHVCECNVWRYTAERGSGSQHAYDVTAVCMGCSYDDKETAEHFHVHLDKPWGDVQAAVIREAHDDYRASCEANEPTAPND